MPRDDGVVPPHDLDAEGTVLGSVILDPSKLDEVADFLKPEHFYSEIHRQIYTAVLGCRSLERPIDTVSVGGWLKDNDRLTSIGGMGYLVEIINSFGAESLGHVVDHARRIYDKWRLRCMIDVLNRSSTETRCDPIEDVSQHIDTIERRVYDVARSIDIGESVSDISTIIEEHIDKLQAIREGRLTPGGIATGYHAFDLLTGGLRTKELTIMAARPGVGKSAWAGQLAVFIADQRNQDTGIRDSGCMLFSLEMPRDQLAMRMACNRGGVDLHRLRKATLNELEWSKYKQAAQEIAAMPLTIDDKASITMVEIRAKVRRKQAELIRQGKSLKLVVIDYMQLLRPSIGSKNRNREQEVSEMSRDCKCLAMDMNISVVALSQLNREIERAEVKRKPRLSDLRETGSLEQDADNVAFLWYPETPIEDAPIWTVALLLAKQRNGPIGEDNMDFHRSCTRFE
jgi:replicative DNA helicase